MQLLYEQCGRVRRQMRQEPLELGRGPEPPL
jgi:hypothetical protein